MDSAFAWVSGRSRQAVSRQAASAQVLNLAVSIIAATLLSEIGNTIG
jgi:hypothetical protein